MNYFKEESEVVAQVPEEEPIDDLEIEEIIMDYERERYRGSLVPYRKSSLGLMNDYNEDVEREQNNNQFRSKFEIEEAAEQDYEESP